MSYLLCIQGAWLRPTADKTGVEVTPFDSIPTAMYWVVINTGDLVPTSDGGRCVSCVVQLIQIFGMAFPVGNKPILVKISSP